MTRADRTCSTCKHSNFSNGVEFAKCMRPIGPSYVTDAPKTHVIKYCELQREDPWWSVIARSWGLCMRSGRFWEPKP